MVNIYKLISYLKGNNIKTVFTFHSEVIYTTGCSYSLDCDKWKSRCYDCNELHRHRPNSWYFDQTSKEWDLMNNAFKDFADIKICCVSKWVENRTKQSPFLKDKYITTVENGLDTDIFNFNYSDDEKAIVKDKYKLTDDYFIFVTPDFFF